MATRIVLVAPHLSGVAQCVEVNSDDASALVASGMVRVSLSKYGDRLATATVLVLDEKFIAALKSDGVYENIYMEAWRRLRNLPMRVVEEFKIGVPIPAA